MLYGSSELEKKQNSNQRYSFRYSRKNTKVNGFQT